MNKALTMTISMISFLLANAIAIASPPEIEIPSDLRPVNGYVVFTPKTDAKSILYISLDGVSLFPASELKDSRRFILPSSGLKNGVYRFVAVGSLNDEQSAVEFRVTIENGIPHPPGPDINPDPKPIKIETFRVMFVIESANTPTAKQQSTIYAQVVRSWLDSNTTSSNGIKGWLVLDKDTSLDKYEVSMKKMWNDAQPKVKTVPCVLVEVNGKTIVYDLPNSPEDLIKLLKKNRGDQ